MPFTESAGEAVLEKIICGGGVARQRACIASKTPDFGFYVPVSVGHVPSFRLW
jgi:hypothetical protein